MFDPDRFAENLCKQATSGLNCKTKHLKPGGVPVFAAILVACSGQVLTLRGKLLLLPAFSQP
ncbi:hypothetical protein [Pseudophaeobacter arcticus]|jgi:hypothetical protein|uniref:hypothetical protein n=1 Tax=Pseudophaeobacter arcticus TaxID=385492 RepID=UPI00047FD50D|nr:hypothetical protein [Pseudophaeobacter arcticus]